MTRIAPRGHRVAENDLCPGLSAIVAFIFRGERKLILVTPGPLQAKLTVNARDDIYEQEADAVAAVSRRSRQFRTKRAPNVK